MAGQTIMAEAIVQNDGNAVENRLSTIARISSVPPLPGLIAFFSVEGADQPLATEVPLVIPAAGQQRLQLEVVIPSDAPLNTRFVLEFELLGVVDEEDLPVKMLAQALIMLNEQRGIDSSAALMQIGAVPHGTSAVVQINVTSYSTMNERVNVQLSSEEGWQTSCNKMLVNETGLMLDLGPGHINEQKTQLQCEILRMNGPKSGTVTVISSTADGVLRESHSVTVEFSESTTDETFSSTALIGGGLTGLLFLGAVLVLLRKRPRPLDDEPIQVVHAGPPVSTLQTQQQHSAEEQPTNDEEMVSEQQPSTHHGGPPVPDGGLPPGWTEEQWQYYGCLLYTSPSPRD